MKRWSRNRFRLTENHLKLARAMEVGWCDDEYGAPQIDPKRPYGNSDVEADVAETIGVAWVDPDRDDEPTAAQRQDMRDIHEEMEQVLAILLSRAGEATPAGVYVCMHGRWKRDPEAV